MTLRKRLSNVLGFFSIVLPIVIAAFSVTSPVKAQTTNATGSICVLAFNDANRNGVRDSGEVLLSNVNASLIVNEKVVIANHVTDGKEPYCFPNLEPKQYTVTFASPLYEATTLTSFTFDLAAGEKAQREFGAAMAPATEEPADAGVTVPVTQPVRIGVSAVTALIVMAFVAAIGLILYGLFGHRR